MPSYFWISYLFLAIPIVAVGRRNRYVNYVLVFSALMFLVWSAGYQLLRFLYPVYPLFSLLIAHGLADARVHHLSISPRWSRRLLALFLGISLSLQVVTLIAIGPMRVLAGLESPASFLSRSVWTYPGVEWANEHLPGGSRLFVVGSGQSYYFRHDALPDAVAANLANLFSRNPDPAEAATALREAGFTHIFVSQGDLRWYILRRDPDGRRSRQARLLADLVSNHATPLYRDEMVEIYRLSD